MITKNLINVIHIILLLITVIGIGTCFLTGEKEWMIPFLTVPMLNIILIPYSYYAIRRDFFNPLLGFIMSLTIGTVLRSFFIISPLESTAKHFMLMGNDSSILITGITHIYIGISFFVLGFLIAGNKKYDWGRMSIFHGSFSREKLIWLALITSVVSLIAAYLYLQAMGLNLFTILTSDQISAKRFMKLEEGGVTSLSYYRKVMAFAKYVFYILVIYFLRNTHHKFDVTIVILMALTGGMDIFFNFINSSRGAAGSTIITVFIIIYYVRGKISKKILIPGAAAVLILLVTMTFLRREANRIQNVEKEDPFTIIVGSLNFLGVGKASFIGENVPEKMDFQYGRTLMLWAVAPIPRTIWPQKPETSIGRPIALKIYEKIDENSKAGGVPPGFITELYMNFGIPAIVLGMYIFGFYLRRVYNTLYHMRTYSNYAILLYILIVRDFMGIVGGDLTRTIVEMLTTLIPLYLFMKYVKIES